MDIYLRTRGETRHLDYDFLGLAPPRAWWRRFGDVNAFERPSVLAEGDETGWRLYVGGIPAKRVDSTGTLIVYSVVMEGGPDSSQEDRELALRLVSAWVTAIAHGSGTEALTTALDDAFPREDVETWLKATGESVHVEVADRVSRIVAGLPFSSVIGPPGPDRHARWVAGVRLPEARAAFLDRVVRILGGEPGQAHVLNMIAGAESVADLPAPKLAVLIEGSDIGDATAPLQPVPAARPSEEAAPEDLPGVITHGAVKVAAALIAAGLLAWVIYRLVRTGAPTD